MSTFDRANKVFYDEALDDEELICALGILPVRCTSQGTRARKLKPQSPRCISNAGGPHKKLMDGNKKRVLPLNEAIGFRSSVNDGKPKLFKELKPHVPAVMSDICVLTVQLFNANSFCQRFGDALLHLVTRRMRQLEAQVRAKGTGPSLPRMVCEVRCARTKTRAIRSAPESYRRLPLCCGRR